MSNNIKWTIDPDKKYPLAIIESGETENGLDGLGVLELESKFGVTDRELAQAIVEAHNKSVAE